MPALFSSDLSYGAGPALHLLVPSLSTIVKSVNARHTDLGRKRTELTKFTCLAAKRSTHDQKLLAQRNCRVGALELRREMLFDSKAFAVLSAAVLAVLSEIGRAHV